MIAVRDHIYSFVALLFELWFMLDIAPKTWKERKRMLPCCTEVPNGFVCYATCAA